MYLLGSKSETHSEAVLTYSLNVLFVFLSCTEVILDIILISLDYILNTCPEKKNTFSKLNLLRAGTFSFYPFFYSTKAIIKCFKVPGARFCPDFII